MPRKVFQVTGITGLAALEAKLRALPAAARSAIRQAMAEGADEIVSSMQNLAPVRRGKLRASIAATMGGGEVPKYAAFRSRRQGLSRNSRLIVAADPDLSVTITAGNPFVRYAHLVEFGVKQHIAGGKFKGAVIPEIPAQPFFYPGYRTNKKLVKARVNRAIRKAAKDVAAGRFV